MESLLAESVAAENKALIIVTGEGHYGVKTMMHPTAMSSTMKIQDFDFQVFWSKTKQ